MTGSRHYQTLITVLLAVVGIELGIYLAGEYFVPAVNTAIQASAPAIWLYWLTNSLVHAGSAIAAACIAVAAGRRLGRLLPTPVPAEQSDQDKTPLLSGLGASA